MPQKILLATRNAPQDPGSPRHPRRRAGTSLICSAHPDLPEVDETGLTFADNAALKADVRLEALPRRLGARRRFRPGGRCAGRRAGSVPRATPGRTPTTRRTASNLAQRTASRAGARPGYAVPQGRASAVASRWRCGRARSPSSSTARWRARSSTAARGEGGFGYDPVFVPVGYQETFAELPAEVKNRLSHRGEALRRAAEVSGGGAPTRRNLAADFAD